MCFDNIVVPDGIVAAPLPETLAAPAAPIHDETNNKVISIFSDAYTNVAGTNFNPDWNQATAATVETLDGNEVLKYADLNYQGIVYATQDVSGLDMLHEDYWTANSTDLNFYLISDGNEVAFTLPITATEEWLSVEIDLSHFAPPVVLSEVFQFKVDGNGTVWFDNLYFYNSESLRVDDHEALSFKVYPNPSNSTWNVSANNQNITTVQVFDLLGKQVISLSPNTSEVTINASSLLDGIYIAEITSDGATKTIKLVKN